MNGSDDPPGDAFWWRQPWDDAAMDVPRGPDRTGKDAPLAAMLRAQDAVARLETATATASKAVAAGLRARLGLYEAAGMLGHRGLTVHPHDLALQEAGLTAEAGAAALTGRLDAALPWSVAGGLDAAPEAQAVRDALAYARAWRALGEHASPSPERLGSTLSCLGAAVAGDESAEWLAGLGGTRAMPGLLAAAAAATARFPDTPERRLDARAMYVAAWLWRRHGFGDPLALGFWSAPLSGIDALAWLSGTVFTRAYLDCVAEAALRGRRELDRLQAAERRAAALPSRAGAHLRAAAALALRTPVLTAREVGEALGVSTRAGRELVARLTAAGVLREATGRRAWRAFVIG